MSKVFYGLAGEGRGHATRARTVVEGLRALGHRVCIFAPDCAYDLLAPVFKETEVSVTRIPGLKLGYDRRGRMSIVNTAAATANYYRNLGPRIRELLPHFEAEKPDLVVADFEPLLPRAARAAGVPFVSMDHQHYVVVNDLSSLPFALRRRADLGAFAVKLLYDWQQETIVSSFYAPPIKAAYQGKVTQVGVLLRPEILARTPERGGYLVVYMRRFPAEGLFDALSATGLPVRFYGLGARPAEGRITFKAVDERGFMDDLAGCEAVVSTAGNQLVGEALYLRKPVLALPEPQNFEQQINGHFLTASGGGLCVDGPLTVERMCGFVDRLDIYRSHIIPENVCGNKPALEALCRTLDPVPQAPARTKPRARVPAAMPTGSASASL